MRDAPSTAGAGSTAGADEDSAMHRRRLPSALIWSPIAAMAAQLLLAAVVAAATGGGDFPRFQGLFAIL